MSKTACLLAFAISACWVESSNADVITFTGGTVTRLSFGPETTNNTVTWNDVDYYEEDGFRVDFLPNAGSAGGATNIGNYYGVGNDVIHSHWLGGCCGGVTAVEITKVGGGLFDLNYFIITSNTDTGGGPASGLEMAWIEGFVANVSTGPAVQLRAEDWGFPATQVFLGSAFDAVDMARVFVTNTVSCFGMDEFFIDEEAPHPPLCFGTNMCPCGNAGNGDGGCANSVGPAGAILSASGVASLNADSLVLSAAQTPNQPGVFFQGDISLVPPRLFGDGLRCCGENAVRIGTYLPAGNMTDTDTGNLIGGIGPPISMHPGNAGLSAGDSRCYQWWYRDPSGPCNTAFNLSNAVEVNWVD